MLKKLLKKKAESAVSAVGGIAVLVGSYAILAAVNAYLGRNQQTR